MADRGTGDAEHQVTADERSEALSDVDLLEGMEAHRNVGDGLDTYRNAIRKINSAISKALTPRSTSSSAAESQEGQMSDGDETETASLGSMIGPLPMSASTAPTRGRQRANSNTMVDGPHRYDRVIQISPDRSGRRRQQASSSTSGSRERMSALMEEFAEADTDRVGSGDRDNDSDASDNTLKPDRNLAGTNDDESPQQFPVPAFVVWPTRVFGRREDGTALDPDDAMHDAADSPFEQSQKLKSYERWNSFCRYLNECRRWRRMAEGGSGEDQDPEVPSEATAEDHLYHVYLRGEGDTGIEGLQDILAEEEFEFLDKVYEWNELNSRQNWATHIMEGDLVAKLTVHQGMSGVHYIVVEENQQPKELRREQRSKLKALVRLFPEAHAKAYQQFLDGHDHAFANFLRSRHSAIREHIGGPNLDQDRRQEAARRREERRERAESGDRESTASTSSSSSSSTSSPQPKSEGAPRGSATLVTSEQPRSESVVRAASATGHPIEREDSQGGLLHTSATSGAPSLPSCSSASASETRDQAASTSSKGKAPVRPKDKKKSPTIHQRSRDRDSDDEKPRGRQAQVYHK